jgi:hypothetical protein
MKIYPFVFFLLLQQVLLYVQPLDRYFLLNQVVAALLVGSSVLVFKSGRLVSKQVYFAMSLFIVLISVVSSQSMFADANTIPNYSWGSYVPNRIAKEEIAGQWLLKNTSENAIIITPRTHVFSYYSHRRALWLNQLGGEDIYIAFINNDVEEINKIAGKYQESYIIIPEYWVVDAEADGKWVSYLERGTVDLIDRSTNLFEKVYEDQDVIKIYKTIR